MSGALGCAHASTRTAELARGGGLRGGEEFRAIGESDRMTLKFRKPQG